MNIRKHIWILRAVKLLIFFFLLSLIYTGIGYAVIDDTTSFTRITFHDFYEESEDADILFLGASHVYRGIDASLLSTLSGKEVYNLSTSSQEYSGSYAILKDAVECSDISQVYLAVSPARLGKKSSDVTRAVIISDYLKNPVNRICFLLDTLKGSDYINGFSKVKRNWNILDTLPDSSSLIASKAEEEYRSYTVSEKYKTNYLGRGCFAMETQMDENGVWICADEGLFDNVGIEDISPDTWSYIEKIIDLCDKNQIELTLFMMPFSDIYMNQFDKYTELTQYLKAYASEKGCGFFDLNLVKQEYLSLTSSDFANADHLNLEGNQKTTEFLAAYMASPSEDYFLSSAEEKYEDNTEVYGLTYLTEETEEQIYVTVIPVMDGYDRISYRIQYADTQSGSKKYPEIECTQGADMQVSFSIPVKYKSKKIKIQVIDDKTGKAVYLVKATLS